MFAEQKIRRIIDVKGGFLLSNLHPGDGIRREVKNHRYNNPPILKIIERGVMQLSPVRSNPI
jgi:hypothetical protein